MPEPEVTILANLPVHHAIHARSRMHSARWTRMPCMPAWPPPPAATGAASTIRPSGCLEAGLGATQGSVEQQLAEIRALRQSLGTQSFDPADIDAARREGRP